LLILSIDDVANKGAKEDNGGNADVVAGAGRTFPS
jgi:hypothetical protein